MVKKIILILTTLALMLNAGNVFAGTKNKEQKEQKKLQKKVKKQKAKTKKVTKQKAQKMERDVERMDKNVM